MSEVQPGRYLDKKIMMVRAGWDRGVGWGRVGPGGRVGGDRWRWLGQGWAGWMGNWESWDGAVWGRMDGMGRR
jgi:hypothetical protein